MGKRMNSGSSYVDELSGVYNRRYLKERQEEEIKTFISKNIPFSLVIVDIDHFKKVNDIYGHLRGDEIIKEFAQFLKGTLRSSDAVIRYGGDEFVCVMPKTTRQDVEWIYRRILKRCKEKQFSGLKITLSAGIASYPDDGRGFDDLLKIADQALYDAKRGGRDQIGTIRKKKIELPMKVFIDRIEEKEGLKGLLTDDERLRVAVVKGNVGVGKTRLGREVLGDIRGREVVWSDCLFLAESIAYYPIREIIKYRIQRWGIEVLKDIPLVYKLEIGKLVPEITEEIKEKTDGVELVLDKYRLYESIRKVIELGEREKIIVIDNIQWIDKESIEVLKYVMRALKDNPVAFIFVYRIEEITDILEDFLSYISREVDVVDIELEPLKSFEIKESVKSIIGEEPKKNLVEYVVRESGGIPFYIEEIMRGLLDKRYLTIEADTWVFKNPEKEIVPKSLEDVAMRKYRSLSKETQKILDIASVIGWFDIGIIKEITGYNEGEIIGLMNNLNRLGMVKYRKDKFEFAEESSRNALYKKNVEGIKGIELHKKVAEKIEARNRGRENEVVEELAFHYYRGKDREKGMKYCMTTGDISRGRYANRDAIRYYTWTLELLKDEKDKQKIEIFIDCLLKRAEVLCLIGNSEEALKDLEKGLEKSRAISDKKREIEVVFQKASIYFYLSRYKEAIEEAETCKRMSEDANNREKIANLLNLIGNAHSKLGENEKALLLYQETLKIFKAVQDRKGVVAALNNIGIAYRGLGDYHRALKCYEDSLKIGEEIGDKHGESTIYCNIGIVYRTLGDYRRALKYYQDSLKISREIGHKRTEATNCNNIGNVYGDLGEYRNALKFYEYSLKINREIGDKSGFGLSLSNIGFIYTQLGEYNNAKKFYEDSLAVVREIGEKRIEAYSLNGMGNIYYDLGDYDNATKLYEDTQKIVTQIKIGKEKFINLLSFGKLYLTLNEMEKAKNFIDKAYSIAEGSNTKMMLADALLLLCQFYLEENILEEFQKTIEKIKGLRKEVKIKNFGGNVNLLLGRYYVKTNDFKKADLHLRQALRIFEELEEKFTIGQVYYYLSKMELVKGKESAYKEYINKSLEIFNSIGAKGWKEKTEQTLKEYTKK